MTRICSLLSDGHKWQLEFVVIVTLSSVFTQKRTRCVKL